MVSLEVKEERLYRVCIGAYKDKNNAIRQQDIAISKGFIDAYIK